jgi:predicted amidohydrolase YtcJ
MSLRRFTALAAPLLPLVVAAACATSTSPPVTLAIVNARVWTGDSAQPWAEAVAVAGDRLVAVGRSDAVRALAGTARVIDAAGGMVTPGFIDSHVHFLGGGFGLAAVQLRDAATKAEFIRRIAAFAKTQPKGTWILRGDWDHTLWGGELPARAWIDSVTPDHPVLVNRLDGHMALANSAALRAAGVGDDVADVPGGAVVRDAQGRPTGVLKDNATALVEHAIPLPAEAQWQRAIDTAMAHVAARGVTAVHHVGAAGTGNAWDELAALRRAHEAGRLRIRFRVAVPLGDWQRLRDTIRARGTGDDWLRIGMLKGFVDGSLGSHTAAMLAGFTDAPADSGFYVTPPDSLVAWVQGADAAGLQVAVHAIGDRAIRTQLDIFERVARENPARDRRFRIEHAQHIAPPEFPRFAQLGVIASMQPYHAADDGRWADRIIGPERARGTYAFRSLRDAGARLAFGSDWFVAPPTPLEGIKAAVTRQTLDGAHPDGWVPAEKITVEDALRAYTAGAAYAGFQERELGTLAVGRLADLVLLDRDLTAIASATIDQAVVRLTVVGGRVVYDAGVTAAAARPTAVTPVVPLTAAASPPARIRR